MSEVIETLGGGTAAGEKIKKVQCNILFQLGGN